MAATLLLPPPVDVEREALAALAESCVHRPLVHSLTLRDLHLWDAMTPSERRTALARAHRRVTAVVPQPAFDFAV